MKPLSRLFVTVTACALSAGCATVITGTTQVVSIDSNVKGASVSLNGNTVGVTPFAGNIPRKKEMVAVVSKDGYASQNVMLSTTFNPISVVNIVWDLSTTDCLTGACWEYAPNTYYVNLKADGVSNETFKRDSEIKSFAMTFYADLQSELAAGDGAHVRGLQKILFPGVDNLGQFKHLLASLHKDSRGDACFFGERVSILNGNAN